MIVNSKAKKMEELLAGSSPFRSMRTRAWTPTRVLQFAQRMSISECHIIFSSCPFLTPRLGRVSVRRIVRGMLRLCATDQDLVDGNVDYSRKSIVSGALKTRCSSDNPYFNSEHLLNLTKYPIAP